MTIKTMILPHEEVEAHGFAQFNLAPHLCVTADDGEMFTISVRTRSGKKVTVCFVPSDSDDYECADVEFLNSGAPTIQNGDHTLTPFHAVGFGKGYTTFDSRKGTVPTTLLTVLLNKRHYSDK